MARPETALRDSALFALTVLAWAGNYLFVRVGLGFTSPLWLAALRALVGAAGVAVAVGFARRAVAPLPARSKLRALALGIPNTAIFLGLWFDAASRVPPGEASVVIYTFPLWVALLSKPVLGHSMTPRHLVAVAAGFAGVALVSQPGLRGGGGVPAFAIAELLAAAVSWACATVLFQKLFPPAEMPSANLYQLVGGAAALLAGALLFQPHPAPGPSPTLWIAVAWLGLYGTAFAYGVWFFLLGRVRAHVLSAYAFLVPLAALGLSVAFVGETVDLLQAIGVGLVALGIYGVATGGPAAEIPGGAGRPT